MFTTRVFIASLLFLSAIAFSQVHEPTPSSGQVIAPPTPANTQTPMTAPTSLPTTVPTVPKVAFVLSGGGAKGSFEVGALKKLYEEGFQPRILAGTSVGAINAVKLAEGRPESFDELWELWGGLRTPDDMWIQKLIMNDIEELLGNAEALGNYRFRGAADYLVAPFTALSWVVSAGSVCLEARDVASQLESETSLFSLRPIQQKLVDSLDVGAVRNSGIDLRLAVVNLNSGDLCYANDDARLCCDADCAPIDLRVAAMASAAIPVFFDPVNINGDYYVDGGVREVIPLVEIIEELDATTTFVILASPLGSVPAPNFSDSNEGGADFNLIDVATRSVDLLSNEVFANDLAVAIGVDDWPSNIDSYFDKDIHIIAPRYRVHETLEIDPKLIRINQEYGWMLAADVLADRANADRNRGIWKDRLSMQTAAVDPTTAAQPRYQFSRTAIEEMARLRAGASAGSSGSKFLAVNMSPTDRREKLYRNAASIAEMRVETLIRERQILDGGGDWSYYVYHESGPSNHILRGAGISNLRRYYRLLARDLEQRLQLGGEMPEDYQNWLNRHRPCPRCMALGEDNNPSPLSEDNWIWEAYPAANIAAEDPPQVATN